MFSRGKWTRNDATEEDSNRKREEEQTGRESVLKERRESAGRKEFRFLPLPLLFFVGYSTRENSREEERTEEASERTHEQGMAVAVAAAALPPHH